MIKVEDRERRQDFANWFVIGTNFTKADTQIRSSFAITNTAMDRIYHKALQVGLTDFFILSTCNRTEFYGCAPYSLTKSLIIKELTVSDSQFHDYFYTLKGPEAILHFFNVTCGLNSQIIGDYEIVGQVKKAVQKSREHGLIETLTDRIASFAFQASKEVKVKTNLSNGKYSFSYAAAELINAHKAQTSIEEILIVGTGEIGQAMARNLKDYFPASKLSLTNRTLTNAIALGQELNAIVIPFDEFIQQLNRFDVIITTAESDNYLIQASDLSLQKSQLLLDLSMPQVIDPQVRNLVNAQLYSVDEISGFHNELMKLRHLEIPKAEQIIKEYFNKLVEWQTVFKHTGMILSYKKKMGNIISNGGNPTVTIEKSFSGLMQQIKSEGYRGCSVIQTVNELIYLEK